LAFAVNPSSRSALPPATSAHVLVADVLVADALDAAEEADRIGFRHVERVIGAEHDVIGAPDIDQMLELALVEHDGVEIQLLQVFRRRAAVVGRDEPTSPRRRLKSPAPRP
jgi:hypothetical protein